jgi:hypothetical protein
MIRFIDLTNAYWTDPECGHPICAFLNTSSNRFYVNDGGEMTFSSLEEISYIDVDWETKKRMMSLIPEGFFNKVKP